MIKKVSLFLAFAFVLVFAGAQTAQASTDSTVYVVHGIPGATVDVCLDGSVAISNFNFTDIAGPIPLMAGTYAVSVAPAGTNCANPVLGPIDLTFAAGTSYSVAAHLTEAGAPTASVFVNDTSATDRGKARVSVHHLAAAPTVDVVADRDYSGNGNSPSAILPGLSNGNRLAGEIRPGDWDVALEVGGATVFGPATLYDLEPYTNYMVFAVGVFPSSFTLLIEPIGGLK